MTWICPPQWNSQEFKCLNKVLHDLSPHFLFSLICLHSHFYILSSRYTELFIGSPYSIMPLCLNSSSFICLRTPCPFSKYLRMFISIVSDTGDTAVNTTNKTQLPSWLSYSRWGVGNKYVNKATQ